VGGAGESDVELLNTSAYLYNKLHIKRAYFSAFTPLPETPLENHPPTSPKREFRLYQASFLLRDYGFSAEDMPFDENGNLPLNLDPKTAWAQNNLSETPLNINQASRQELLRIPGIGPKSAAAILSARRRGERIRLHDLSDLHKIGVNAQRAAPYILLDGKRPTYQLRFC
jgi:predicted DNA-binding helix-hairpin-helix protein